jgi:hypothetical protein
VGDERDLARRIFEQAVADVAPAEPGADPDRWEVMRRLGVALGEAAEDPRLLEAAGGPVALAHDCIKLLLLHFPEAVPLDDESLHGFCLHEFLDNLGQVLLRRLDLDTGMDYFHTPKSP